MSLDTWKNEFYPIDAKEAAKGGPLAAAKHSLQKWIGLRNENLEKHGMQLYKKIILEKENVFVNFWIDDSTCALCRMVNVLCHKCPFMEVFEYDCSPDYDKFYHDQKVEPMIESLEAVVKHLEEKQ